MLVGVLRTSLGGAGADTENPVGAPEKDQEGFLEAKCRRLQCFLSQLPLPLEVLQWPLLSQVQLQSSAHQIPKASNSSCFISPW